MRYNLIRKMDVSDGPGIRVSVFTQGCFKHCPHCFNSETWDPNKGTRWTKKNETSIIDYARSEHYSGLSILGGEPLLPQNYSDLKSLIKRFKKEYPNKTVWMWTGFVMEDLDEFQKEVVNLCDVLIDGPYIHKLRDTTMKYCGSTNQRLWKKDKNNNWYIE